MTHSTNEPLVNQRSISDEVVDEKELYPVNMLQYSDETLPALLGELITAETVGKKNVYNIGAAFDTEASSFVDNDDKPVGLCYIWMFGIGKTVLYGRSLGEFTTMIRRINGYLISQMAELYVYVHNLKYDFSFIKKLLPWDKVFCHGPREPLYAQYGQITFKDSLVLSGGQSLASVGKKLRSEIRKAEGDLDYTKIRHENTPLTQREMHYCEMDVRVLIEYINEKIEDDGSIINIPSTNTGYVRRYVRNACFQNRGRYMELIDGLTLTPDCYLQMEKTFGGGAVGPNIKYNTNLCAHVHRYDIKSSYPYVMVTQYFPMSFFEPVPNKVANDPEQFKALVNQQCCQFTLEVFNLVPKTDYCFPISESKCNSVIGGRIAGNDGYSENGILRNQTPSGRVMYAAYVSINVTELDWQTINDFYDLSQAEVVRISRMRVAKRGFLPRPIIESILKFFFDKTTLDGVEGKEREYMIAKNMLNACYGMMVEKIVRDQLIFKDDFEKKDKDYLNQVIEYNNKRNRFLYYPWGVWVTAHARRRLYDAIREIGDDWRYCDTDCVKFVGDHQDYFDRVNREARENLKALAKRLNLQEERVIPISPSGEKKYLGVWEHEADYALFKTLGAKRYLVNYGDKFGLTVAGTNKKKSLEYMVKLSVGLDELKENLKTPEELAHDIGVDVDYIYDAEENAMKTGTGVFFIFNENLIIPPEYSGRTVSKFVDSSRAGYIKDYLGNRSWYTAESGIYIENSSYSFSITDDMKRAMEWLLYEGHDTDAEI